MVELLKNFNVYRFKSYLWFAISLARSGQPILDPVEQMAYGAVAKL